MVDDVVNGTAASSQEPGVRVTVIVRVYVLLFSLDSETLLPESATSLMVCVPTGSVPMLYPSSWV